MRIRLDDSGKLVIKINGIYDREKKSYSYELAEPLPPGLGVEDFVSAIVETRIPQWYTRETPYPCGNRYVYSHVTDVTYDGYMDEETGKVESAEDETIHCRFVINPNYGDWSDKETRVEFEYCPANSSYTTLYVEKSLGPYINMKLSKTVDEATGDITYDYTAGDGDVSKYLYEIGPEKESTAILFQVAGPDGKIQGNTYHTKVIATELPRGGSPAPTIYYFARYLNHEPSEVIVNESVATCERHGTYPNSYFTYAFHLNFTVPAANVKDGV